MGPKGPKGVLQWRWGLLWLCAWRVSYVFLRSVGFAAPGWKVLGKQLPSAGVDIQVYEGIFEAVVETFLLPAVPN